MKIFNMISSMQVGKLFKRTHTGESQYRIVLVAGAVALVILAAAAIWKIFGGGDAPVVVFDPQVLNARVQSNMPAAFPDDLPLEKNEKGFELTQSNASLDYMQKSESYLIAFATPWNKESFTKAYESYFSSEGFDVTKSDVNGESGISISAVKGTERIGVVMTERALQGAPAGTPPWQQASISFTR